MYRLSNGDISSDLENTSAIQKMGHTDRIAISVQCQMKSTTKSQQLLIVCEIYTVNQKKTWQFIFEYNFG